MEVSFLAVRSSVNNLSQVSSVDYSFNLVYQLQLNKLCQDTSDNSNTDSAQVRNFAGYLSFSLNRHFVLFVSSWLSVYYCDLETDQ